MPKFIFTFEWIEVGVNFHNGVVKLVDQGDLECKTGPQYFSFLFIWGNSCFSWFSFVLPATSTTSCRTFNTRLWWKSQLECYWVNDTVIFLFQFVIDLCFDHKPHLLSWLLRHSWMFMYSVYLIAHEHIWEKQAVHNFHHNSVLYLPIDNAHQFYLQNVKQSLLLISVLAAWNPDSKAPTEVFLIPHIIESVNEGTIRFLSSIKLYEWNSVLRG